MMNVAFRVDSSIQMGSGHVMRCLTLADQLQRCGANSFFICRELQGNLANSIRDRGFNVEYISVIGSGDLLWKSDALETSRVLKKKHSKLSWIIVDHYELDISWEQEMRVYCEKLMVIDDLANRAHDCDVLLDQNLVYNQYTRYDQLVPLKCTKLLGPDYTLLNDDFSSFSLRSRDRLGSISRILVSFGGSDQTNETYKAIEAIVQLRKDNIITDVVLGIANPHKEMIIEKVKGISTISCHIQVKNMAELMWNSDLMLGSGGVTTWERCILGLPSIIIVTADNQIELTKMVCDQGAAISLGHYKGVTTNNISTVLENLLDDPTYVRELGMSALKIMSGYIEKKDELCRILIGE